MLALLLCCWSALALELPPQLILDSRLYDDASERSAVTPYVTVTPSPLQLTAPAFETLFLNTTLVQSRSQGSPSTSMRGSAQASRVLFLLDNIPLNFADGFGGATQFVPTELLGQVHIFAGPTSALYGSSAVGGVLHFVPQKRNAPLLRLGLNETDDSSFDVQTKNFTAIYPLLIGKKDFVQIAICRLNRYSNSKAILFLCFS